MICDGSSDCADGDDEEGCDDFVCSGALRCRLDNICIHPIDICDGVMHCLLSGDDESLCDMLSCPKSCVCRGTAVLCHSYLPDMHMLSLSTRAIVYVKVSFINTYTFGIYTNLLHINIHNCDFPNHVLTKAMFIKVSEVHSLLLRNNSIWLIESNAFEDMHKLMFIDISGNSLRAVQEPTFHGLQAVALLDLSSLYIETVEIQCFVGLLQLATLNLSSNLISSLKANTFSGMHSIQVLDISDNNIEFIDHSTLLMFNEEVLVHVSQLVFCCYLSTRDACHTSSKHEDQRKDQLDNQRKDQNHDQHKGPLQCFDMNAYRTSIANIVLSLLVVILALFHIIFFYDSKQMYSHTLLLQNLFLFSSFPAMYVLYLNISALVIDNDYIYLHAKWLHSISCLILNLFVSSGFLLSKLTVLLIVINQLFVTKYIFVRQPLSHSQIFYCLSFGFVINLFVCLFLSYKSSGSPLCFIFVVNQKSIIPQIVYVTLLLFVTFVIKVVIIYMYHEIYIAIKNSEKIPKNYGKMRGRKSVVFVRRAACFISTEVMSWFIPFCLVLCSVFVLDISSYVMRIIIAMVYTMGFVHNLVQVAPKIITKVHMSWVKHSIQ